MFSPPESVHEAHIRADFTVLGGAPRNDNMPRYGPRKRHYPGVGDPVQAKCVSARIEPACAGRMFFVPNDCVVHRVSATVPSNVRTNQQTHVPRWLAAEMELRLDCCDEDCECDQHRATCYRIIT